MEISLIKDYNQKIPKTVLLVESDSEYVKACSAIARGRDVSDIWVRKISHYKWLQNFTEQINKDVKFVEKTPRLILADRWNVKIPDWLDDLTVSSQNLLSLDIENNSEAAFVDLILDRLVGKIFYEKAFKIEMLPDIISNLANPQTKDRLNQYPVLSMSLTDKFNAWKSKSSEDWTKELLSQLSEDAEKLWKELTSLSLLKKYPDELLAYVVPADMLMFLNRIPFVAIAKLPMNSVAKEQSLTQINMFFDGIIQKISTGKAFDDLINCVSGKVKDEFQWMLSILNSKQISLSAEQIELIKQKFSNCPGIGTAKLSVLDKYIDIKKPIGPAENETWDAEKWCSWTINEYISFRDWQLSNNNFNPEVEDSVQSFSNWYIEEYLSLHSDTQKSLVHTLTRWKSRFNADNLSLVLLIDCLPFTYWHIFNAAMIKAGFHRHELQPVFCPLPSDTIHSKQHLLSGAWDYSEKGYEVILRERAAEDWAGKEVYYLPNLKELINMEPLEKPSIVVLNFLPADETLHSDVELKGSTYEEELYRLFARVADTAKNLLDSWQGGSENFSVYIVTDHGACMILDDEKKALSSNVLNKLFKNEKHRYASIGKPEGDEIPDNLWELGYRFNRAFVDEDSVYFIPRGHNTVKFSGKSKKYVHGGASPEEIIVPTAVFKPIKAVRKDIAARFIKLKQDPLSGSAIFYIQRVETINIEIQNPNDEIINVVRVDVLCPDADVKGFKTAKISEKNLGNIEISCYFNSSAKDETELSIQLTYSIAGEEKIKELNVAAEFKSAVTGGFSLKNL